LFLLPTSGVLPLQHLRADRYLYMAAPGMAFLCLKALDAGLLRVAGHGLRRTIWAIGYVVLVGLLVVRLERMQTDASLWRYEVAREPACLEGHSYLAQLEYEQGSLDRAWQHIERIRDATSMPRPYYDRQGTNQLAALLLLARGEVAEADALFSDILASSTGLRRAEAFYHTGLIAFLQKDYAQVTQRLENAHIAGLPRPSQADALLVRATAHLKLGHRQACALDWAELAALDVPMGSGAVKQTMQRDLAAACKP
jgi:tetratricopeptide (TPR) repeat protein